MTRKRRASVSASEERVGEALRLSWDAKGTAWIRGGGWSMFPTSPPGCRLCVAQRTGDVRIGQIVVFARGGRLIAHRVVGGATGAWVTKGDGAYSADPPIGEERIIGRVTALRFAGLERRMGDGTALARSSECLSLCVRRTCGWLPVGMQRVVYGALAVPVLLVLVVLSWQGRPDEG